MEFTASKSIWIKIITIVLAVGFVALAAGAFLVESNFEALLIPLFVLLFVFGLSYYFSIRRYEILGDSIIVHRPFDQVAIAKTGIKSAQRVAARELRMSIRTFGIGGVFSFTGQFWNGKFGSMTWYVTRMDRAVILIDAANNKTVISPDEPDAFIAALATN